MTFVGRHMIATDNMFKIVMQNPKSVHEYILYDKMFLS